jgi:8-oxo-dGTP diphosphatase
MVLLVQRSEAPFATSWALPGGAVEPDEPLDTAAARLLAERTGIQGAQAYLEQLYTFGDPGRDPRGRTVSVTYFALLNNAEQAPVRAGRGVQDVAWWPVDELPQLAFDHGRIAAYARRRLAQKLTYTPLAFHVLPETFTLGDLRTLYEAVEGRRYDPSNFPKQMLARWDLAPVPGIRDRRTRRPARLYRYIGPREIAGPPHPENLEEV